VVKLNRIYTRTGDDGRTGLATGERTLKCDLRVSAYGDVDELNAAIGLSRLYAGADPELEAVLIRVQNDLFDLGADLATPDRGAALAWTPLRMVAGQVERLEAELDRFNADLSPLNSFVLPAGTALSAHLHLARTVCRRAERSVVRLSQQPEEPVNPEAIKYLNRLSDLLFVAARRANDNGRADVLWTPGANR
jgi:cob(I)alamin adenosyltransferase